MKHTTLVALLAFCKDMQLMDSNILVTLPIFEQKAKDCLKACSDPNDKPRFIPLCVDMDPVEFYTEFVLIAARYAIISGIRDYGSLNSSILKAYKRLYYCKQGQKSSR